MKKMPEIAHLKMTCGLCFNKLIEKAIKLPYKSDDNYNKLTAFTC